MTPRRIEFVLGGARSGKTRHALGLAGSSTLRPVYIATATAFDAEMRARIAAHQSERGANWTTVEAPLELADAIWEMASPQTILLVDCLTLWLNNLMYHERDIETASQALVASVREGGGPVILVSNEIGLGLVPETALGRRFRDAQGSLNQAVAEVATRVTFVAAGLPLILKG